MAQREDENLTGNREARDDVISRSLPINLVIRSRKEEVDFIEGKGNWILRPISECWEKARRAPVFMRWVNTNKAWKPGDMEVISRM
eukprot:9641152-Karenia_brevis.AAC.1